MKKILCLIIVLLSIISFPGKAFAVNYSQKSFDHDRFLGEVLFGRNEYTTKKNDIGLQMLQKASYLTIDQMNNTTANKEKGQQALDYLRRQHVRGLPRNVDSINPSPDQKQLSGTNHRTYTHMGWKYPYESNDIAHSEIRAEILQSTVVKVFDFKMKPTIDILGFLGIGNSKEYDDKKCDAVCRLVYYVHVLGDCFEDENYYQANGTNNGRKIPLGRTHPNETKDYDDRIKDTDIIGELIFLMPELFPDQESSSKYKELMTKLNERKAEIRALYGKTGTMV